MRRTDHDEFDGLAVGWALHALEPDEEQEFASHLATCDHCQQLVRESEEALGDLAYDVPLIDPPQGVLDRIRQATGAGAAREGDSSRTQQESELVAPVVTLPQRKARSLPRWPLAAIAAGVVMIALLGWNVVLQNRVDETQRIAAQRDSVIKVLGQNSTRAVLTDAANRTVGYVVQRGDSIDIVAGGLAPNDRERTTYVLWAVQGSGEPPEAVGTFDVVRTTLDVRIVSGSSPAPDSFTGFAVSKEPGREVPQRPSQVVASGAVVS